MASVKWQSCRHSLSDLATWRTRSWLFLLGFNQCGGHHLLGRNPRVRKPSENRLDGFALLLGCLGHIDEAVQKLGFRNSDSISLARNVREPRIGKEASLTRRRIAQIARSHDHVGAKSAEFGGEAKLGVDLKIQEGGGDGGGGAEREQGHKQAGAMRTDEAS